MIDQFTNALMRLGFLAPEELDEIINISTTRELKVGEYFFKEGSYAKDVAFVYKEVILTFSFS